MIIECPSCHARYMVPIGLFASGGRKVRCARCKYEWHEKLPTSVDVFVPLPEVTSPSPLPIAKSAPKTAQASHPSPSSQSTPPLGVEPEQAASADTNLPAVVSRHDWKKIILRVILGVALAAVMLAWPIMDRDPIVKAFPALRGFYNAVGLHVQHSGRGLVFEHVKSELRYDGGTMRLYVDGVIHNATGETQMVPDIKARAIGPDQRVIQSWWVAAPAATVDAESDLPFHTEVSAPMKRTIDNVYLEFYSPEEKDDASP